MNSLSKTLKVALLAVLCLSFTGCEEKKEEVVRPPDPLENAAGTYSGSVQENSKVIPNIKANLTTASAGGNGSLYITSIGFASSDYQLVVSNPSPLNGVRNGLTYKVSATVNGKVLNVSGTYSYGTNSIQNSFSFTGTKQ